VQGSLVNVTPAGKPLRAQDLYRKSFENEIDHFYRSILDGTPPISGGADGVNLLRIIEATYRSAAENCEIQIENA
jgi:predicted dehydrogenase